MNEHPWASLAILIALWPPFYHGPQLTDSPYPRLSSGSPQGLGHQEDTVSTENSEQEIYLFLCGLDRERQPERERDKGRVAGERETAREIERERERDPIKCFKR